MASASRPHLGFALCVLCVLCGEPVFGNPPAASYVFPAGGQRGTTVPVRVGGLFLHDKCAFDLAAPGVKASPELVRDKRLWFEGPVLPLPDSQRQEDYPADMRGTVTLAADAKVGPVRGRVFTSQGGAGGLVFVVGELPEVVEAEVEGDPIPKTLALPVTANGRIFPHEDIDLWEFDGEAGKTVTAYVHAQALNSPLVPQLDVLDARGNVVAEQMLHPCVGTDASVRFTPKVAGKYRVRITDARTLGGPAYVYRLTVTTADVPQFHFPLRVKPDGLKDVTDAKDALTAPVALNGHIEKPGAANEWKLDLKKGGRYALDLVARRADSPLCAVVTVTDATGKEVAKAEASETNDPAPLAFAPAADGVFTVRVGEKYRGRGGPNFAYRLAVTDTAEPVGEPGFRLALAADAFTVPRSGTVKVKVTAERTGGFAGPIVVRAVDLPKGVTAAPVVIPRNQPAAELTLTAAADAHIATAALKIEGIGIAGVTARLAGGAFVPGTRFLPDTADVRLTVALPTPFKILDEYIMTSAARGEVYKRKYKLDRGGFDGPIEVQLADKQARHLQGVTGPVLALKPGETDFEYPAYLPPWMELGRTCRVCVMATAKVKDPLDGREHTVSFSSTEQNQQMIVVVSPGRLDMSLDRTSLRAEPGGEVRLQVTVARDKNLTGPARVEAVLPAHWKGVTVAPLVIPADRDSGELVLKFARDCGPFNAPLIVRATVDAKDTPVTAEAKVEIVR